MLLSLLSLAYGRLDTDTRLGAPVERRHELFGFLTTKANAVIAAVHPQAMPVILTTPGEIDVWLAADATDA